MKEKVGPPRFCSRSASNVPSRSHAASTASSMEGWSGTVGSGWKTGSAVIGKGSLERDVLPLDGPENERTEMAQDVTDATFDNEVLQSSQPVLVRSEEHTSE